MHALAAPAVRHQRVELVEVEDHRGVLPSLGKQLPDLLLRAVDIGAREIRGLYELIVPARLLGELLGDEGLAASRRAVEQHAVRDLYSVLLRELRILQHVDDLLPHHGLEVLHAGDIGKAVSPGPARLRRVPGSSLLLCPGKPGRISVLTAGTLRKNLIAAIRLILYPERVHELTGRLKALIRIHRERLLHRLKLTVINVYEPLFGNGERALSLLDKRPDVLTDGLNKFRTRLILRKLQCPLHCLFPPELRLPGPDAENQPVHHSTCRENVRPHGSAALHALRCHIVEILPMPQQWIRSEIAVPCILEAGELQPAEITATWTDADIIDIMRRHRVMDYRPVAPVKAVKSPEQRPHQMHKLLCGKALSFVNQVP